MDIVLYVYRLLYSFELDELCQEDKRAISAVPAVFGLVHQAGRAACGKDTEAEFRLYCVWMWST